MHSAAQPGKTAGLHGLLDGAAKLLAGPNQEREALLTKYRAEFRPTNTIEEMFVSELASADWRIKQFTRIEAGIVACQMQAQSASVPLSELSENIRTLAMGAAWVANQSAFALLVRCQNQARRDYYRALKELEALRRGKAGYLPKQTQPAAQQKEEQAFSPASPKSEPGKKCETKPNPIPYNLKWEQPNTLFVPTPEEWRQILGQPAPDSPFQGIGV